MYISLGEKGLGRSQAGVTAWRGCLNAAWTGSRAAVSEADSESGQGGLTRALTGGWPCSLLYLDTESGSLEYVPSLVSPPGDVSALS